MRSPKTPSGGVPGRILIIDDHAENVALLERILAKAGYRQVASTTNSDDALALHKQFKSDLVLLDFHMTGKDGFEVLEEIVSNSAGHPVSVIMITGDDTADVKRRALALGAKDSDSSRAERRAGAQGHRAHEGARAITARGSGAARGSRRISR
jgi:CheY-like chemotaxis protein